jgi:flagellar motor protein MotB
MPAKILAVLALAAASIASVGCAQTDLQRKFDDLSRENEELQRDKAFVEADYLACKARCESLERRGAAAARPAAPAREAELPSDLRGRVDIRRRGNDTVINLPSDVFFSSGSSSLNPSMERTMVQIADFIRREHPGGLIRVEGHSDTDPIKHSKGRFHCNWELSFERAHAVMHHLVDKGRFDPRRVVCEAYGEYQPQDPKNKSKNRRVEIVIGDR